MTIPLNEMTDSENFQSIDRIVNNFVSPRLENSLNPLTLASVSVSDFSTELANHLFTLNEGGSIALGRGENLASMSLSKCLNSLFSTSTPLVKEGPSLTWTRVVLFAGPNFEGPTQLEVEGSSVELSAYDLKLLRSGRPWRFLSPWPDGDDCTKELQFSETALQELVDARQIINQVLETISLVEQRLRNHHTLVSRLSGSGDHATHQEGGSTFNGAQSFVPIRAALGPEPLAEDESPSHQDLPTILTPVHCASKVVSAQPVHEDANDRILSEDAIMNSATQRDESWPSNDARPEVRLHTADFIQSLSEILDDPNNWEVMRWSEDGKSVVIAQESDFSAHILAKMSTKSYQSLIRRLYYYGFHKTGGSYRHDHFIRGQPSFIRPTREMSHSPSLPSPLHKSSSQGGPRYKVIKRKRTRDSAHNLPKG